MRDENKTIHNNSAPNVNDLSVKIALEKVMEQNKAEKIQTPLRILDLGTGEGYNAQKIHEILSLNSIPHEIIATDINPSVFLIRNVQEVKFIHFDLHKKPDFGLFDVIMATEVIEHLENPYDFFRLCHTHLKENGHVIISSPNVANIFSCLKILLRGIPSMFSYNLKAGHIMPISPFFMQYIINKTNAENKTQYKMEVHYNRNVLLLPLRKFGISSISIPGSNRIFGEIAIYKITKAA